MESYISEYQSLFEKTLNGRYITAKMIAPLLLKWNEKFEVKCLGFSVEESQIYKIKLGSGNIKVLMWSQMHGNESTTTKAVFDLLNFLDSNDPIAKIILSSCEIHIIPILNPDGAHQYTRVNKNGIDLNRDAQLKSQPESLILHTLFNSIKPDFCFNLHDQRTIFNVGDTNKPATISFLSPAEDEIRNITPTRKKSMELIAVMNNVLQKHIPGQVGRYDDSFNINCVGDTFQSSGVPTILFESGHFPNDYEREITRKYIFCSLVTALKYISANEITGESYGAYFSIPENGKLFYDILLKNAPCIKEKVETKTDIGILYEEVLKDGKIIFTPFVKDHGNLTSFYGHREYDLSEYQIRPLIINELSDNQLFSLLRNFQ